MPRFGSAAPFDYELDKYETLDDTHRFGSNTTPVEWYPLTGYTGKAYLFAPDGTVDAESLVVEITEETVDGEGGTINLYLETNELSANIYGYEVWLIPPDDHEFKYLKGTIKILPSGGDPVP